MILVYGWFSLSMSPIDEDKECLLPTFVEKLDAKCKEVFLPNEYYSIAKSNAAYTLHLSLTHNHIGSTFERVMQILDIIRNGAPGSFGICHFYNGEDREKPNEFTIYKMTRGRLEELRDPFFSPVIPTIEE